MLLRCSCALVDIPCMQSCNILSGILLMHAAACEHRLKVEEHSARRSHQAGGALKLLSSSYGLRASEEHIKCQTWHVDILNVESADAAVAAPQAPQRTFLPAVPRIIAIGDLHGDLEKARRAFRLGGLIDERDHWIGGTTTGVQVRFRHGLQACVLTAYQSAQLLHVLGICQRGNCSLTSCGAKSQTWSKNSSCCAGGDQLDRGN